MVTSFHLIAHLIEHDQYDIYVSKKGMWVRMPGLKSSSLSDGH